MNFETIFSTDRIYRYTLWRYWCIGSGYAMFIGLNPSTTDESKDDPTIRRCMDYAQRWGYSALCMVNLFAYRSTDPRKLQMVDDPVGPENDRWIRGCAKDAGIIIAAWGAHGLFMGRDYQVSHMIPNMHCLKKTLGGFPSHPLYLKKDIVPFLMDKKGEA